MSSVGSSDSSNRNDEIVRRNREEYRKSESELIKKQKMELRRLNEQHYAEMERIKNDHARQMAELQRLSNSEISARDHRYQKEIEGLRDLHRRQVQQTADENLRREEMLKTGTKGSIEHERAQNQARLDKLNADYKKNMENMDRLYREAMEEGREAQQRAIEDNRKKLTDAYNRELAAVKKERHETVSNLQKDYASYRASTSEERRNQKVKSLQDQERASDNLMRAVRHERELRNDAEAELRQGFNDGLDQTAERYEKALKKEREAQNLSDAHMKSSVRSRVDGTIRRLEQENLDLKEKLARNEILLKQKHNREISNLKRAYQKNVDDFKFQRDETIQTHRDVTRGEVDIVRDHLGQQLIDTNRFYRDRMDEQNRINRNALKNLKGDYEARSEQTKSIADQRVMRMHDETEASKQRMIELQNETHELSRRQKLDEIKNIRHNLSSEKDDAIARVHEQMRKQEIRHTERMGMMQSKYEKEIAELKDQLVRERKNGDENLKRTVAELQRAHKMALDQADSASRERMRQASIQHNEQVRSLNKRHEEKLDQVITEVKKTT